MPKIGFISDLHLAEEQPERIKLFLSFLEQYTPKLEQLYILGDLFEVWLGDDLILPAYQPVIEALKQASTTLSIKIIHGNRDFLLGNQFEELSGCKIAAEPLVLDIDGKTTLLMHGDLLCTDDHEYIEMRQLLHSPEWTSSFLNKSAQERIDTARQLRQQSQTAVQQKNSEIMDANNSEVVNYLERYQVEILIHGHTHRTATHTHLLSNGKRATRYVLDEWHNDGGQILIVDQAGPHFELVKV